MAITTKNTTAKTTRAKKDTPTTRAKKDTPTTRPTLHVATLTRAKKDTPTTRPTLHVATFEIAGAIKGVYEGEKYDYVTINVDSENINPRTNEPYYNTFSVACPKSMEIPEDGAEVRILGNVQSFYNKDRQRTEYAFYGVEIYGINDAVDLANPF